MGKPKGTKFLKTGAPGLGEIFFFPMRASFPSGLYDKLEIRLKLAQFVGALISICSYALFLGNLIKKLFRPIRGIYGFGAKKTFPFNFGKN